MSWWKFWKRDPVAAKRDLETQSATQASKQRDEIAVLQRAREDLATAHSRAGFMDNSVYGRGAIRSAIKALGDAHRGVMNARMYGEAVAERGRLIERDLIMLERTSEGKELRKFTYEERRVIATAKEINRHLTEIAGRIDAEEKLLTRESSNATDWKALQDRHRKEIMSILDHSLTTVRELEALARLEQDATRYKK